MTDEEKAIEYCGCNQPICRKGFETNGKQNCTCARKKNYLDGLAEGRKEGYEQGKNNERELQCGRKNYEKDIAELEKENAELKKQNESLKDTLQAIATDTNEHITHNVAQNELDKWEK